MSAKHAAKLRRLRQQAQALSAERNHREAAKIYEQLEKLEPRNGEWPRRAADCYWHLKEPRNRLACSVRAAEAYAESGLLLKAIAMGKVALSIDPHHNDVQARLAELHARWQQSNIPGVEAASSGRTPVESGPSGQNRNRFPGRPAALAALLRARADKRVRELVARKRSELKDPESQPSTAHGPPDRMDSNARAAPSPAEERPRDSVSSANSASFANPAPSQTEPTVFAVPPLRIERPPKSRPRPGLDAMKLSERVPSLLRGSLPPPSGHPRGTYSLDPAHAPPAERVGHIPSVRVPPPSARLLDVGPGANGPGSQHDSARGLDGDRGSSPPVLMSLVPPAEADRDGPGTRAERDFAGVPLLGELSPQVLRELITEVGLVELETGEVLFEEGELADAMFVVVEGAVRALSLPQGRKPTRVAQLREGDFFGEVGLLSDQPRNATVTALEPTRLLRFDRDIVAVLIDFEPEFLATLLRFIRHRLVEEFIEHSELFTAFEPDERQRIADWFEFLEIDPQFPLLDRGQPAVGMYVFLTGEAVLEGTGVPGTRRRLGPGDIVGEQALLSDEPSSIRVVTQSKCFALCLPSDAFLDLIDAHPVILGILSELDEAEKGELEVTAEFLQNMPFF